MESIASSNTVCHIHSGCIALGHQARRCLDNIAVDWLRGPLVRIHLDISEPLASLKHSKKKITSREQTRWIHNNSHNILRRTITGSWRLDAVRLRMRGPLSCLISATVNVYLVPRPHFRWISNPLYNMNIFRSNIAIAFGRCVLRAR